MKNLIIILGVIFISLIFYCQLPRIGNLDTSDRINNTLLFSTIIVIAWYTIETNLLRAATVKNTEVSISPKFAIEYIGDNKLKVSNIGNGTALNIKFKKLIFEPNKALKAEIDPIQYLEAGRTMEAILQFNMGDSTLPFGANLDPKYLQTEQSIDICHEDILHNKISQKCTFGKKGTTIAGTS